MKVVLALCLAIIAFSQAYLEKDVIDEEWNTFKVTHKKTYNSSVEDEYRKKIFINNKLIIARHNAKYENRQKSHKLGINKYADMLHTEVITKMNGFKKTGIRSNPSRGGRFIEPAHVTLPKMVDWRREGAVTAVKDQGHCGSCWAFSATGSLEGQHFRSKGYLVSLSEQNLVDCSNSFGNNGCNGGMMDNAFRYIKVNHGIDTEKTYPYEAEDDKCRYKKQNSGADDVGYIDIPEGDEKKLEAAVATVGPISVAIDASHQSFQLYSEGVYDEPECSSEELDHGVLVVGYGTTEDGQDYWLVKNSWGDTWGEKGYIKMSRNKDNQCGIASSASYPLV